MLKCVCKVAKLELKQLHVVKLLGFAFIGIKTNNDALVFNGLETLTSLMSAKNMQEDTFMGFLQKDHIDSVLTHLSSGQRKIYVEALRVVGGTIAFQQSHLLLDYFFQLNFLAKLADLLRHDDLELQKDVVWILSNIVLTSVPHLQ